MLFETCPARKLKHATARLRPAVAVMLLLQVACASVPEEETSSTSVPQQLTAADCDAIGKLMVDSNFETVGSAGSLWRYRQHAGLPSFTTRATSGELVFKRAGSEPWAIIRQTITDPRLSGRVIRFSAELKGDISDEVTHGFGAKSGLFLRMGPRPDAIMADHEPNVGQWEWQRVSVEARLPDVFDYVEAGFLYQGGEGVLTARKPQLELPECLVE